MMIERYVTEFERWIPGDPKEKAECGRELLAHLTDAESEGKLADTLARLGTPRAAARAFLAGRRRMTAPLRRRALAGLVDYAPLLVASVALAAYSIAAADVRRFSLPATVTWNGANPLSFNIVFNVIAAMALGWTVVGLGVLELRNGRTPGKALYGLRTISSDGTALDTRQALVRRVSFLFGPLVIIDLLFAYLGRGHQRGLDHLLRTSVVVNPTAERRRAAAYGGPEPATP